MLVTAMTDELEYVLKRVLSALDPAEGYSVGVTEQDLDDPIVDGQVAWELVTDLVHRHKEELRELLNA